MKNTKEVKDMAKRMGLDLRVKRHRNHIAGIMIRHTEETFRAKMANKANK